MSDDLVKRLWLHDCEGITREAADRIEALEAKLAKAVKVLVLCRDMFDEVAHPSDPLSVMLNTIVTELNGDKP